MAGTQDNNLTIVEVKYQLSESVLLIYTVKGRWSKNLCRRSHANRTTHQVSPTSHYVMRCRAGVRNLEVFCSIR